MKEKSSFVLYHDIRTPLELLNDEDRGKLFMAILNYSEFGEEPDFDGALQMAFAFIKTALDRDTTAWETKRAVRAEAGRKGGKQNQANQAMLKFASASQANQAVPVPAPVPVNNERDLCADKPPKNKSTRFIPPSVDEVRAYCAERANRVDPEKFVDFYAARGWVAGKAKMKDWKAAVRTWERSDQNGQGSNPGVGQREAEADKWAGYDLSGIKLD